MTHTTTADRAYVQQATTPADAAGRAAALNGISLPGYAAQQIADAVLGYADNTMSVREGMPRHLWETSDAREHLLQAMRRKLLEEITSQGLVPTALPTQTLAYQSWRYGNEQPFRASEAEPAEWDTVEITLTVPVRVPPVDRKVAVKAGILSGGTR